MNVIRLSRFLGWFSIGLGAMQILCGRTLARKLGMTGRTKLFRAFGVREVTNGLAILANPGSAPLLWARVAGDALDMATLAGTPSFGRRERATVKIALAAVAGVALLDILCATRLSTESNRDLEYLPPYWD
ncbi:hypothetical protein J8J14_18450 [Roseomonas sp. SSH11]|uniref:Uncharacterized protein n=1 Tax=Pararoseomonas baculiformis TaxID=2820812 RepID=A0ABS4AIA9_9PROT|nr:hypothetical protein [Pararoseomonas baculiformis]MBP0446760.1 hypothetical protein [Pararoseomonas baculiformis]